MKLGIMQPYFMPYIGYFQLMKSVNRYVVYDDVNFIKGGWINRNNILMNGCKKLFSISLKQASPNKLINEIEIGDDFNKIMGMLRTYYGKAPYYKQTIDLLERIICYDDKSLGNFIMYSFEQILDYLNINTELILSSTIDKDCELKGKDKVLNICKQLGAKEYYNAIGGQELYSKEEFAENGVALKFVETELVKYKQFDNEFVSGLSMIDVMMFNSPEEINIMLDKYNLI